MEDVFWVPIMEIDPNWIMRGFSSDFYALEYCDKVLCIPREEIKKSILRKNGLEIHLLNTEGKQDKKWYLQLRYLSVHKSIS